MDSGLVILIIATLAIAACIISNILQIYKDCKKVNIQEEVNHAIALMFASSMFGILLVGWIAKFTKPTPAAIDVYRGNTEMNISYKIENNDTISCDTTITFKNNK